MSDRLVPVDLDLFADADATPAVPGQAPAPAVQAPARPASTPDVTGRRSLAQLRGGRK